MSPRGADRSPRFSVSGAIRERERVNGCFAPSIVQFARSTVSVRRLLLLPGSVLGQQLRGGDRRLSSRKRVATFLAFRTKSDGRAES